MSAQSQPVTATADAATPSAQPSARVLSQRYGKWTISYDPPPIPVRDCDYAFSHDDFDASYEGEEDGWVGNGLCGRGASVADCLEQIADIEAAR